MEGGDGGYKTVCFRQGEKGEDRFAEPCKHLD